ncbi:DUF4129 domain-containing protein [Lysinimonas soli]|uniref:DUF4129 domain-containing protein n=1 Tax=Lysinimonas soli TaxID=1074233 RepID=A0ABW0NS60_9MICO
MILPLDVPVDPDAPEAQRWLLDELSKPQYQAAKPGLLDQIVRAIQNWLSSLRLSGSGIPVIGDLLPIVLAVLVAALLVVAFLIFGVPRLNRRGAASDELFGADDRRDADALRRDALRAAAAGDYATAIAELFRALARGLAERTLVSSFPGSTANDVAARAARVFPDAAERLRTAARSFDGVRYLGAPGSRDEWDALVALEGELRGARPTHGLDDDAELVGQAAGTAGETTGIHS